MWFSSTYAICSTQDEAGIRIHKKYIALQDSLWFSVTSHREVFTLEVFWWMNLSVLTLGGGQCSDLWRLWQGQSGQFQHAPFVLKFQWGEILGEFSKLQWSPCFLFGIGQIAYRERNGWGWRGRCQFCIRLPSTCPCGKSPPQRQFSQGDISRTYQDSLDPDFFQSL